MKILVADDDNTFRTLVIEVLTDAGYEVYVHTPVFGTYTLLATYDRQFSAQSNTVSFAGVRPLYDDGKSDPSSIPADWRAYFDALGLTKPAKVELAESARPLLVLMTGTGTISLFLSLFAGARSLVAVACALALLAAGMQARGARVRAWSGDGFALRPGDLVAVRAHLADAPPVDEDVEPRHHFCLQGRGAGDDANRNPGRPGGDPSLLAAAGN